LEELTPAKQLAAFIGKFDPRIAKLVRSARSILRNRFPTAIELVYDNYNWLVVGFGPNERASDAVFSLVFAPRWLALCFLQDASTLPDPQKLLRGSGKVVRNVRLMDAKALDAPAVRALIAVALKRADVPIKKNSRCRIVIRAISRKQRPRRPLPAKARTAKAGPTPSR